MNYLEQLQVFVVTNFLFGDGGRLTADVSLLGEGIIDSAGILEMIAFIEKTYTIRVEDEELLPDNLDNLRCIASFVARKVAALAEQPAVEQEA